MNRSLASFGSLWLILNPTSAAKDRFQPEQLSRSTRSDRALDLLDNRKVIWSSMSLLSISPSGAQILEKVTKSSSATLAELASKLRLSPTEIRSDISELQQKGWAELDDDSVVVHVTPEGKNAYHLITKHPEIFEETLQMVDEEDLDAALDRALEKNRAGHSENAAAVHPMDNLRNADSKAK